MHYRITVSLYDPIVLSSYDRIGVSQFFDNRMFHKFNYDTFVVTANFRDDYSLSLTASDSLSGDFFINEQVELTKIKKDTIIATLSRKCENQLKCEFSIVDVEPKKLILAIIVAYDFLPTFTEFISLEQLEKSKGGNKVQYAELSSDIEDLERAVAALGISRQAPAAEQTLSVASKGEIFKSELSNGNYVVEVNGYFLCPSQPNGSSHDMEFLFSAGKQEVSSRVNAYTLSSYGCPIALRAEIEVPFECTLTVSVTHSQGFSFTLNNAIITVSPALPLR